MAEAVVVDAWVVVLGGAVALDVVVDCSLDEDLGGCDDEADEMEWEVLPVFVLVENVVEPLVDPLVDTEVLADVDWVFDAEALVDEELPETDTELEEQDPPFCRFWLFVEQLPPHLSCRATSVSAHVWKPGLLLPYALGSQFVTTLPLAVVAMVFSLLAFPTNL